MNLSTNVSSANARRHLKAHPHTTEYQHPASPVAIANPKIALLFLVTTNVKHAGEHDFVWKFSRTSVAKAVLGLEFLY